jgi:hypothetical protein
MQGSSRLRTLTPGVRDYSGFLASMSEGMRHRLLTESLVVLKTKAINAMLFARAAFSGP